MARWEEISATYVLTRNHDFHRVIMDKSSMGSTGSSGKRRVIFSKHKKLALLEPLLSRYIPPPET